jgi:hypothetical protein
MKKLSFIALILALQFFIACAQNCTSQLNENTTVTNLVGLAITPELCIVPDQLVTGTIDNKTATKPTVLNVAIPQTQNGSMMMDSYSTAADKGTNNQCQSNSGLSYSSQIFLTDTNFSQYKLCRDDSVPTKVTFVGLGAGCPTGSTAQATAVTAVNCTTALLIHH